MEEQLHRQVGGRVAISWPSIHAWLSWTAASSLGTPQPKCTGKNRVPFQLQFRPCQSVLETGPLQNAEGVYKHKVACFGA